MRPKADSVASTVISERDFTLTLNTPRIECARKYFAELYEKIVAKKVKYDVVTDYAKLMDLVNEVAE